MLGSAVPAAVVVVVSEVPLLLGQDGSAAAPAGDGAGFDGWPPCLAGCLVCGTVSALGCGASCLLCDASVLWAFDVDLDAWTAGCAAHALACAGHGYTNSGSTILAMVTSAPMMANIWSRLMAVSLRCIRRVLG